MTSIHSWDFTVHYPKVGDQDTIEVGCVGVGSGGDRAFRRDEFHVGYYKHDPYSLVARQWFDDHPPAPKVWKVGDIVPKDTVVGKAWTAAPFRNRADATFSTDYGVMPMNVSPDSTCREARVILWIEP